MLIVLWIMNCYWSLLFLRVAYNKLMRGAVTNDVWGETDKANKIYVHENIAKAAKVKVD